MHPLNRASRASLAGLHHTRPIFGRNPIGFTIPWHGWAYSRSWPPLGRVWPTFSQTIFPRARLPTQTVQWQHTHSAIPTTAKNTLRNVRRIMKQAAGIRTNSISGVWARPRNYTQTRTNVATHKHWGFHIYMGMLKQMYGQQLSNQSTVCPVKAESSGIKRRGHRRFYLTDAWRGHPPRSTTSNTQQRTAHDRLMLWTIDLNSRQCSDHL